jgi:hypothetical protein
MAATVAENIIFDKKMQNLEKKKKNSVRCKLLPNFRDILQLWPYLCIMVDDSHFKHGHPCGEK